MANKLYTLSLVILLSVLLYLPACQATGSGSTATPTLLISPEPTYPLPSMQYLPSPQLTPTSAPTPQLPDAVAIEKQIDIRYTSREKIDVYSPLYQEDWPIVVILHGGGLYKESVSILATAVAEQGAVVFAPEYQSYAPPPDKIMTGAEDAACAIRFARVHGPDYGGDPNRIIVVGHSAGGAFGALIALAGDRFQGDCLVTGVSAVPDMFIGLDGAYDILRYISEERLRMAPPEDWLMISPFAYISSSASPKELAFHLFVGEEMELLQNAQAFRDALLLAGYQVSLTQFPGVDHMYIGSGNHKNTVWAIVSLMNQLH